jgi:hypothetical protein
MEEEDDRFYMSHKKNIRPKEVGKKIKDEKGGHGWAD